MFGVAGREAPCIEALLLAVGLLLVDLELAVGLVRCEIALTDAVGQRRYLSLEPRQLIVCLPVGHELGKPRAPIQKAIDLGVDRLEVDKIFEAVEVFHHPARGRGRSTDGDAGRRRQRTASSRRVGSVRRLPGRRLGETGPGGTVGRASHRRHGPGTNTHRRTRYH